VKNDPIGIGGIGVVLPDRFVSPAALADTEQLDSDQRDFVEATGIRTVGVLEEEARALAARAVRTLVADTGAEPDVLLLAAPRSPDVLLGSDVAAVQAGAGLRRAFGLTVDGLGCVGSSAAWALAADLLRADPSRTSVMLAHASRPTGPDRVRFPVTVVGDGACAMTLVPGGRPVLRAHRAELDGRFHDLFRVDYKAGPAYEWREVCDDVDQYRFTLALHSRDRLKRLVEQVLADAGVDADRVAATLMQNVTAGAFDFYESLLSLDIHDVCRENLRRYGHLGAMDVVLNLRDLLAGGDLARGDLVLVLNNSQVAAWAVSLWEV
jgi:3-oxoacyl-[acyl-carrier-protein] synthase-3